MAYAVLKIRSGRQAGKAFPLVRPEIVIGRSRGCDIRPEGCQRLSRKHARIWWDGSAFAVEDLDSLNGTRVDGEPVRSRRLHSGQTIELGDFAVELSVPPEGPEFAVVPARRSRSSGRAQRHAPGTGFVLACVFAGVAVILTVGVGQFERPKGPGAAGASTPGGRTGASKPGGRTGASTPGGRTGASTPGSRTGTSAPAPTGAAPGVGGAPPVGRRAPADPPVGSVGLSPEIQDKAAGATVWIVTKPTPDATVIAFGTGFCALDPSLIVTCRHVVLFTPEELGTGGGDSSGPVQAGLIVLVLHSGTKQQKAVAGEVAYVDPDHDLALIRMKEERLEPLPLGDAEQLVKTATCWAIGYPAVETRDIGRNPPEVSVQRMEFQTPRHDDNGDLARLQFGGTVTHGNSGGPIPTTDGKVVGVVWRAAREGESQDPQEAAGISYAVPSNFVREMAEKAGGAARGGG
jgi:hypothetical protein